MPNNIFLHQLQDLAAEIAKQNAQMREGIAKAVEVLKTPVPDTFLGRKTHEPFPSERERPLVRNG